MKRLKNLIPKDTFYLVLFTCVCVVAASGVWVSKNNLDISQKFEQEEQDKGKTEEIQLDISEAKDKMLKEQEKEIRPRQQVKVEKKPEKKTETEAKPETKPVQKNEQANQEPTATNTETQVQAQNIAMNKPVNGDITRVFAQDKLIYSKTLEQWTTHDGIDISAAEGTPVLAAMSGTVKDIKKDDGMGIVITIDHGNGIQTRYANLATDEMVKKGQSVSAGTAISKVGKGTGYEVLEGPHLHFEVLRDGKHIDPKQFIK